MAKYAHCGDEPFIPSITNISKLNNKKSVGGLTKGMFPISEKLIARARYSVSIGAVVYGESPDPYYSVLDWVVANVYPFLADEMVAASRGRTTNPIRRLRDNLPPKKMCTMDLLIALTLKSAFLHYKRHITPSWANLAITSDDNPTL